MELDQLVEEWASKYKPIKHIPGENSKNKRFFLVDSIVEVPQLAASFNLQRSPIVAMEFHKEGILEDNIYSSVYTISIIVKVSTGVMLQKERSNEAVKEAMQHTKKLIAWLRNRRDELSARGDRSMESMDLERVKIDTLGPLYNNWYSIFFTIEDTRCEKLAYDPSDYE